MKTKEDAVLKLQQCLAFGGPQQGQRYKHYKGGTYVVLGLCIDEATLDVLVRYRRADDVGALEWVRTLENFTGGVDEEIETAAGLVTPERVSPVRVRRVNRFTEVP